MEIKLVMINGVINKQCSIQTKNSRFVVFHSLLVEWFFEVLQKNITVKLGFKELFGDHKKVP